MRWAARLGPGTAQERTRFVKGGLAATVERFAALVQNSPGALWRLVRELRIPHGNKPDQFSPEPFDVLALADWLTRPNLDLDVVTGAEWLIPAMGKASSAVSVSNLVVTNLPEVSWANIGFAKLRSLRGSADAAPLVALIRALPRLPALGALTFADSGRWRFTMTREGGWRWEAERLAPTAAADVDRLVEAASLIGASAR